jgi:hypothetical protein
MSVRVLIIRCAAVLFGAAALCSLTAAQSPAASGASAPPLTPAQLDQLTAPIALYSDPLLGMVLAASTYPLEVVEAGQWLRDSANADLAGSELTNALQTESWDASVKSLVAFPDVLRMMYGNLQWTEQLGDAFLAQQPDVMDSVQRLRQRAAAAGALQSTTQQTVITDGDDYAIDPADADQIFVPYYDPSLAYGPWPWAGYPPYFFPFPPDIYLGSALIVFGGGIDFGWPYGGWYGWDWHRHGFGFAPRGAAAVGHPWQFDPGHRRGVPFRDAATAARFGGSTGTSAGAFRGYAPGVAMHPSVGEATRAAPPEQQLPVTRPAPREDFPEARPRPPAFESFGPGPQTRGESSRGISSRSAPVSAPPPSSRGGGGGGRRP